MPQTSTTAGNDPQAGDATADSTTTQDSTTATDNQPADKGDNLEASKSTESTSADGDKTSTDDKTSTKDDGAKNDTPVSFDDDLDEWIEKRKLPKAENDEQKQEYQNLRNSQREFTRSRQAKDDSADLGKTVNDAKAEVQTDDDDDEVDPFEQRLANLEAEKELERTTRLQSEFYHSNNVTADEHKLILDIFKEKIERHDSPEAKRKALEYWGTPAALPDLLDLAKARIAAGSDTSAVADEAAREERERIAKESQANSTSRSAKSTSTSNKTAEEERMDRLREKYS
jgi:hypothetical protein